MKVNRVRRVGNSNVVSLPRELEGAGFGVGAEVVIEQLPTGEILLLPADRLRKIVREYGRRAVADNRAALRLLAEQDNQI